MHPTTDIDALLSDCRDGFSLPAAFYRDPGVFALDVDRLFLRSWFFACHLTELSQVGDFVCWEAFGESIVITRVSADRIDAHHNVCRHRGSRLCQARSGNQARFVCPYHGWVYDLEGQLVHAREMGSGFNREDYSLHRAGVAVVQGMVFVNPDGKASNSVVVGDKL